MFRDVAPSGFSRRLAGYLSPNAATGLDLVFGVAAMALVLPDHWLSGVVLKGTRVASCVRCKVRSEARISPV